MGENVDDCPYEGGDPCPACHAVFFDGKTPKYILATVTGIEACPFPSAGIMNGAFMMEQDNVLPCTWRWEDANTDVTLELDNFGSGFVVRGKLGLRREFFSGFNPADCWGEFDNRWIVCGFMVGGIGGHAIMSWGCSIHP